MNAKKSVTASSQTKNDGKKIVILKPIPKWLIQSAWIAVLLTGIVMSLKSLTEPDTWWQLRTGEWIVKNGKVPTHDIFSYTMNGSSWINVKWLYEVLIYFIQDIGGPEFVLILQAIVTVLILIIIRKIYNSLYETIYLKKPDRFSPFLILVLLITLICIGFRLNCRPELFSYLLRQLIFLFFSRIALRKAIFLLLLFHYKFYGLIYMRVMAPALSFFLYTV